jgi:hypothetical protein
MDRPPYVRLATDRESLLWEHELWQIYLSAYLMLTMVAAGRFFIHIDDFLRLMHMIEGCCKIAPSE